METEYVFILVFELKWSRDEQRTTWTHFWWSPRDKSLSRSESRQRENTAAIESNHLRNEANVLGQRHISLIFQACFFLFFIFSQWFHLQYAAVFCELDAYKKCAKDQMESFISELVRGPGGLSFVRDDFELSCHFVSSTHFAFHQTASRDANTVWTRNWTTLAQSDDGMRFTKQR